MRVAGGRIRFGGGFGPATYVAALAAVLVLAVALLLVFPAKALAAAELSIRKDGPSRVEPGERFDYVLTVSNDGDATATNVRVEDQLPTGVTFENAKEPAGVTCAHVAGNVTCDITTLEPGASKVITLTVRAPANAGVIENEARATIVGNPDSARDSNKVTTTVAPRLVINKLDDPDPVNREALLLYTLRVENVGDSDANLVTVRDDLPLNVLDFVALDSSDFDCGYKAGIVKCTKGTLLSGETGKIEIAVEPEKAGTIQNRADVFVQGISQPLDTDTEKTKVRGEGGGGDDGGPDDGGPDGGNNLPEGDDCSPVVKRGTDDPIGVLKGTAPQTLEFTNTYSETLPLRIIYSTSAEDGSLNIKVTPKDGGEPILNETIEGRKKGVIVVDTDSGATYDVVITPENQGYAVLFEIGSGPDPCTKPGDLDPPGGPGDDGGNSGSGGDGADDVIDETISDNPLPSTGGPSLLGLAVVSLGIAAVGGATVVRTGVRRRDR